MNYGKTQVLLCEDENDLGTRAACTVAQQMRQLLTSQDEIRMIFAAGESQGHFLDALSREPDIDWARVVCFNMDDFWDPRMPEQYTCGYQTRKQLYDKVVPRAFHLVKFNAPDAHHEAKRFESLLRSAGKIDILCQGIGTSAISHSTNRMTQTSTILRGVRVVDIAEQSKRQLLEDPNFKNLGYIPEKGITMTIPALLRAERVYTMVPLALKRNILTMLFQTSEPSVTLPASILRWLGNTFH